MTEMLRCGRCGLGLLGLVLAGVAQAAEPVDVAIVLDGPHPRNERLIEAFQSDLQAMAEGRFELRFTPEHQFIADWTAQGVQDQVGKALKDTSIEVILAIGPLAGDAFAEVENLPRPVFSPFVSDPLIQGLPRDGEVSGKKNFSYLTLPVPVSRDLDVFTELIDGRAITALMSEAAKELVFNGADELSAERTGAVPIVIQAVSGRADEALAAIPESTEAVYMGTLEHMTRDEKDKLLVGLRDRGVPVFSRLSRTDVLNGAVAAHEYGDLLDLISRRLSLHILSTLEGEDPGTLAIELAANPRLLINLKSAEATGVSVQWDMQLEAELLEGDADVERLSIAQAIGMALEANLDLAEAAFDPAIVRKDVGSAASFWLPRVDVGFSGGFIDKDRAELFGQDRGNLQLSARVEQLLFSDDVLGDIQVNKHVARAADRNFDQVVLDVTFGTASSYLDVLRAQSLRQVRKADVELTRSNLELAEVNFRVGSADQSEVFRWQTRLASSQQGLVLSQNQAEMAWLDLNRQLNVHAGTHYDLEPFDPVQGGGTGWQDGRFETLVSTPRRYGHVGEYLVVKGIEASPGLQSVDAGILARKRQKTNATTDYFVPEVSLYFDLTYFVAGGPSALGLDKTFASLGFNVNLPLISGGAKAVESSRQQLAVHQAETGYQSAALALETQIRQAHYRLAANARQRDLAIDGARAAENNLGIVQNNYAQGVLPIINLIDAQNTVLQAQIDAVMARYDVMESMLALQYLTNTFQFNDSDEAKAEWYQGMAAYVEAAEEAIKAGEEPPPVPVSEPE